ncbi:hypothetical protein C499_07800 [Halogeometricum borinquense DSM 11551]|uniref:DUF8215 domain-containing protein n=2 Tax=Halogeometricum borinquense TaxID=60847 RepID=E4NMC9_HALBP|nr:hypothetical protein Hbor_17660 [Halogeometricum borinquense DSM 11551]ELY28549.1 hypothetical protein C499_07800 [Halogeometricum borinquense DSM 11551]
MTDMSRGATDPETEARQVRPQEENDELGQWLEDLFDGTAEATVLGLPSLLIAVFSGELVASAAALGAAVALSWGVAAYRNGRLSLGPEWPPVSVFYGGIRLLWYNTVYLAAVFGVVTSGLFPTTPSGLAAAIVAGVGVATVGVLTFPFVAAAADSVRRA